jgi:DNA-binding protein HU-beta
MTRGELVAAVAEKADIAKKDAESVVSAVFGALAGALGQGDEVRLHGFGTFAVSDRPARTGRNPRTGEAVPIPASRTVKFRAASQMRDTVNPGKGTP